MNDDYLVSNYFLENVIFSKPKKHGDYLVCKVKYCADSELIIQFPKMKIASDIGKIVELEFSNNTKYNKESYNFLSTLDDHIGNYIFEKSTEWFGKQIPMESLKKMYNKFIKAPKTVNDKCTMNFNLKKNCSFLDTKGNDLDISEFSIGLDVECIAQLKYIMFSKDNCFTIWELCTAKLHKKVVKVKQYGFIEQEESESETDDEEIFTFFS